MKTENAAPRLVTRLNSFILIGVFIILAAVVAVPFYTARSSALPAQGSSQPGIQLREPARVATSNSTTLARWSTFPLPLPVPFSSLVTVATYASDCTTAKTLFNLADTDKTVCAKVTGALPGWRIIWSNANQVAVQNNLITSDPQTSTFTLTSASSVGDWRVIVFEPFGGSVQKVTSFTVIDAANPVADLGINKSPVSNQAAAGSQVIFAVQVTNNGPSTAVNAQFSDAVPANTTFVSVAQVTGPVFTCTNPTAGTTGTTTCTIATLDKGAVATFIATYKVDGSATPGTQISNTANISSGTPDANNLNNASTAFVTVAAAPCVLTCPSNITQGVDSGQAGAIVNYSTPTSTGACGQPSIGENGEPIPVISCSPASGSFFPVGTTTVGCFAQTGDACTFQVTIDNPGGLSITLNGANPFALECGTEFNDPGASAVNGAGRSVPVTVTLPQGFNPVAPAVGSYTLTYTATEGLNSVSTTRTVNVSDSAGPVITIAGPNPMTVSCGQTFIDPGVSANDACEGAKPVTSSGTVDTNTPGTYTITYTASDSANHTTTATRTVIVEAGGGTAPPRITLIGDPQMLVECGSFTDPGATAVVPCGGSVPVTTSGTVDAHTPGTYTIIYTACVEDTPGHCDPARTSTVERTVIVKDTTAPTITVNGTNPLQVECHGTFTDPGATAHDACAGDFAATASGTVDPNTVGSYTITYNATDPSGNAATPVTRTVNVVDTTPPTITINGDNPMTVECHTSFTDPGATANDSCAGPVSVTASGSVNANAVGTYTITYSATDGPNTATATRTVQVVDTTKPTLTLSGANPMTIECHTGFTDPGATASDTCAGDLTGAIVVSGSVNPNAFGDYTLTYSVSDGSNTQTATRIVHVVDTTPPTITVNGANPMTVECHTSFTDPGATAHDNCSPDFAAIPTGSVNPDVVGTYTITYNASDTAGNPATPVTRTVIVQDTTKPVITLNGANPQYVECHTSYTELGAKANDSCAGVFDATPSGSVNANVVGTYTITYNATDPSGNAATPVTRTVNVVDTKAPTIALNGANPMTVECHTSFTDPGATAHDNCSADFAATASGTVNANAVGSYTITYNAHDPSGNNAAAVTRTVNVVDTTAPTVTAPAGTSAYSHINCQAQIPNVLPQVVASDSCGSVTLQQSPAAGTLVGIGPHTITVTATDPSGNHSSATTTFTVVAAPAFSVSVNPTTAHRGSNVILSAAFDNCATTAQTVTLKAREKSPCDEAEFATIGPFTLQPGQHGSTSFPFHIPSNACTGQYTLTVDWYVGGIKIGTTTAQLTVIP
ncbi:MAG TPA: immunoglobulin-like domain-containing protein [Pyrinomonadaceae bacterium]|nr:immunoglobulin-like domain-containing protein [Pyrinomonadaceae bacterium]